MADKAARTKTVVYGGAFNPPTVAHQVIFQECVDFASENDADVWILPSGNRVDKTIAVDRALRLTYIEAMFTDLREHSVQVDLSTIELDRHRPVETYDTVVELAEAHPDREFIWVFGADSTETMPGWKNGQWLLDNVHMLLLDRPGSKLNPAVKTWSPLSVPVMDVSSTELRHRVQTGKDFRELVSPSVFKLLS
jgi:nicotinate-nucleotide adenylyltransferase